MKKSFLSVVLALLLSLSFASNVYAVSYHENDIEKYIIGQLSNAKIPGGEISIVTSGKEVYSASFGDVGKTDSDLKIGSLSKIFTSVSTLQLIDTKKISLDTNIKDIISNSEGASDITVEELLKQTSGYTAIQKISSDKIPSPLGKKGEYQDAGINYVILGKIIEEVSGESYSEYIQKNIFKPLQLESTYTTDDVDENDITIGHDNLFGLPVTKSTKKTDEDFDSVPATGIVSDVKDMGNVLSMFLAAGGKTLSYDQIEKVYSDGTDCGKTIFDTEGTSGLGWIKTKVGGQDVYYVSGAIDGYISSAFLVPGQDLGITMLFDTSDVISGNDVIEELMSNVVCLAIGEKARTIDSKAVMLPHIEFDIIYVIAFFASLVPIFLMSWWYRSTRKKGVGIARTVVDVVIHIGLPIVVYECVPIIIGNVLGDSLGSWYMIKKFLPECYYVTLLISAILLAGIPIKVISAIVAIKKGPFEEDDEDILVDEKSEEASDDESEEILVSDENCGNDEKESDEEIKDDNDTEIGEDRKSDADKNSLEKEPDEIAEEIAATKEEEVSSDEESGKEENETAYKKENDKKEAKKADLEENDKKENEVKETAEADSTEIVKEFKTRKKKKQDKEEYESSFEREAVKALENNNSDSGQQTDIDGELSDIKADSAVQTAVPKIKKRYNPQKGMPVKIVVEPDDELDN